MDKNQSGNKLRTTTQAKEVYRILYSNFVLLPYGMTFHRMFSTKCIWLSFFSLTKVVVFQPNLDLATVLISTTITVLIALSSNAFR